MKLHTVLVGALAAATTSLVPVGWASATNVGPRTTEPVATFEVTHDPAGDVMEKCEGSDGAYEQIRSGASGTMTSTDPRLSGTLRTTERILLNRTKLTGVIFGTAKVLDPLTGAAKFTGELTGVLKGVLIRGVMRGSLADGSYLVANFSAAHDPNTTSAHSIRGTLGAPSSPPFDLAVIQSEGCSKWAPR